LGHHVDAFEYHDANAFHSDVERRKCVKEGQMQLTNQFETVDVWFDVSGG